MTKVTHPFVKQNSLLFPRWHLVDFLLSVPLWCCFQCPYDCSLLVLETNPG
jgi:hypothetical protein